MISAWAGVRGYSRNIHDSENYVAVVYGLRGVFPLIQLNRAFTVGEDDNLPRPGFLGIKIGVLGFDRNNQRIDCCERRDAEMRDDELDGN